MRRPFASSTRDLERDVGRHFHAHRAIGLDRRVGDDLAHHARGAERGVVRIGDVVVVRHRYRLLDADEARLAAARTARASDWKRRRCEVAAPALVRAWSTPMMS